MSSSYRVEFVKSAKKEFDRLPAKIQERILEVLRFLETNPFSDLLNVKKLKRALSLFRFRVGDYRVVYEIRREILVILVIKIGHRSDVYRNL